MPKEFAHAWNSREPRTLSDLFSQDASFVNVVGLWWNSREEIYRAHEYGLRVIFPESNLQPLKVRVRHLEDTVAIVNARFVLKGQSAVGEIQRPGNRRNIFTFVMKKANDRWICVAAHNTDIISGAETQIVDKDGKTGPADYRDNL